VKKGDRVMLVVEKGSMKITVPGVVKEKGFKNSLIQVQNLQTKKTVFGQVVDPQTVKVNF
jgi:flagellar basal body P-ring formation protein FlgA